MRILSTLKVSQHDRNLYPEIVYNQAKYFFMEIINTFKQSIAKIFDSTSVFVSCKTYTLFKCKQYKYKFWQY